jgi:hypothetical protein
MRKRSVILCDRFRHLSRVLFCPPQLDPLLTRFSIGCAHPSPPALDPARQEHYDYLVRPRAFLA